LDGGMTDVCIGQTLDGPSHGAAPLPWDIRCNPTQMFHTEIRYLEVPHTATIAVRIRSNSYLKLDARQSLSVANPLIPFAAC